LRSVRASLSIATGATVSAVAVVATVAAVLVERVIAVVAAMIVSAVAAFSVTGNNNDGAVIDNTVVTAPPINNTD
jgi:hypothetical protein